MWINPQTSHLFCTSFSTAESYQYQLQSMWQKCWNSQNLVQHMRFRERGPLKSWRPETMAEAIFSVLKEGLSLSQAARKYDIPYPTFVLYANRVHNMLGPSMDGGTDLRPKGRGRPQRILLGLWPDEHIKGVIKSVVFRDEKILKEDPMIYGRQSVSFDKWCANVSRKTHHTWDFNFYDFVSSMSLLLRLLTAISISRQLNGSVPKRNESSSKSHRRDDSRASCRGAPTNVQYGRRSELRCRL